MFLVLILRILKLRVYKSDCITPNEIVTTTTQGFWMRKRFSRVPIGSIIEASMVENITHAIRGERRPLRLRVGLDGAHGVRLLLKDGSSQVIGFEYPAKALAAIQEAMKTAA